MMTVAAYHCPACGRNLAADRPRWRCDCGGPLELAPGPGLSRGDIAAGEPSLWRYAAALPLAAPPRVTLGEGWTPLVGRDWLGAPVFFKLESQMPTGSFKDRGTAVMINHLLEVGVGPIHEDSSGNAGSSIATYAAAGGIPCRIYVPASAPRAKLVQIAAAGAELRPISGTRQAVTEAALAAANESFYASHNWHPYFIEGTQTLAFELWEQLGFRLPDNILVPTGYGSNILGLERGVDALERAGEIAVAAAAFRGAGGELRGFCGGVGGRCRWLRAVHSEPDARRRHRDDAAGATGAGVARVAPLTGRRRGRRRGRDRAGIARFRPARAFCRADRRDRRRGADPAIG